MSPIEEKIRKLKILQLEALKLIADSKDGLLSSKELGDTTSTSTYQLGALLTPLRRIKIDNKNLIIHSGRGKDDSVRWQINEDVITRDDLMVLLIEMGI